MVYLNNPRHVTFMQLSSTRGTRGRNKVSNSFYNFTTMMLGFLIGYFELGSFGDGVRGCMIKYWFYNTRGQSLIRWQHCNVFTFSTAMLLALFHSDFCTPSWLIHIIFSPFFMTPCRDVCAFFTNHDHCSAIQDFPWLGHQHRNPDVVTFWKFCMSTWKNLET